MSLRRLAIRIPQAGEVDQNEREKLSRRLERLEQIKARRCEPRLQSPDQAV
jgi:hypothetical protein